MTLFDRYLFKFLRVRSALPLLVLASLSFITPCANATWSILIADTRTGEIVIGSATCVEAIDLRMETPVLISGVGAVTAQSALEPTGRNRMLIRDRLLQRVPLGSILDELEMTDPGHANRQYGFITASGGSLTYSGVQNALWAGGITGRIEMGRQGPLDDIVYSVQGNILSGPNVVQDAVDAIVGTDSDLPGRLMAAMRAAQMGGGDGRCSCSSADPTGCGSPPPPPFKSAHVGYMLGTRADDIDSVRAFYPITNNAGGMALPDLNHDSMSDIVIGDAVNNELSIFINTALPGDPLSHVFLSEVRAMDASETIGIARGDFNADGLDDLAVALASPPTLSVLLGQPSGSLAPAVNLALPAPPTGIGAGDLLPGAGDELAISLGSLSSVRLYDFLGAGDGQPSEQLSIDLPGFPTDIAAGDFGPGPMDDLAITLRDSGMLWIGRSAGLSPFADAQLIATPAEPVKVKAADMDLDGDADLVVLSGASRRARIYSQDSDLMVFAQTGEITVNREGRGMALGDFNGDALPDIVTTSSSPQRNLQVFLSAGDGSYTFDDVVRVGPSARSVELSDMNASGDLDLVIGEAEDDGLMLIDNPRGTPLSGPGRFADGDYFLELNISNQRQEDPDPVDQLADAFAAWRAGLEGKVDAVESRIIGRGRFSPLMPASVVIELRDLHGELLPISDPGAISISGAGEHFTLGAIENLAPGRFTVSLAADESIGAADDLVFRAESGGGRVRLMPDYRVSIVENLADFNANGRIDYFDISDFLEAISAGRPDADINGDMLINYADIVVFLQLLAP